MIAESEDEKMGAAKIQAEAPVQYLPCWDTGTTMPVADDEPLLLELELVPEPEVVAEFEVVPATDVVLQFDVVLEPEVVLELELARVCALE